jgi:hypothetical protein
MLRALDKPVDKLSKSLVQVFGLCAVSTTGLTKPVRRQFLYIAGHTAYTPNLSGFAQSKPGIHHLLPALLYPLSTTPITNTKLIKD